MDNQEIKKQAKKIIDNFAKELEKVKIEEARVEREQDRREEGEGEEGDEEFRKIMFENAPDKDNDCIVGEKGSWEQ